MSRLHYCQSSAVPDCINVLYVRERTWEALYRPILGRERCIGTTTSELSKQPPVERGTHPPLFFPWNMHQLKAHYWNCLKHLPCSKLSNKYIVRITYMSQYWPEYWNNSLCYVLYYVMLCYVMLCYVMLCYVMLCYNVLDYGCTRVVVSVFVELLCRDLQNLG